jgi:hypothetical protein
MLQTVQPAKQLSTIPSLRRHEITEVPDLIIPADDLIPVPDEGSIVFRHVVEWSAIDTKNPWVSEVSVSGEKYHGELTKVPHCRVSAGTCRGRQDGAPGEIDD